MLPLLHRHLGRDLEPLLLPLVLLPLGRVRRAEREHDVRPALAPPVLDREAPRLPARHVEPLVAPRLRAQHARPVPRVTDVAQHPEAEPGHVQRVDVVIAVGPKEEDLRDEEAAGEVRPLPVGGALHGAARGGAQGAARGAAAGVLAPLAQPLALGN